MTFRKLEIVVHSAKDLDDVKFFGTMNPYATFCIAAGGVVSEIYKTDVAEKAGCYPVWNNRMEFELDPTKNDYVLFCVIQHDGTLFDRTIGEVEVPFTELLEGDGSRTRASYPVKIPYLGEVKGEIIISHKFSEPVVVSGKKGGSGTTTGKVSSVGGSTTRKGSSRTGTRKKDGSMRMSSNKVSRKRTSGKEHTGNVRRPKETVKQKKKDGSMRINSNKVSEKGRSGKVERKKDGLMKKIVKNVGVRVGTEAVLLAGTVGAVVAGEFLFDGNEEQEEDNDKDEDENEDEDEYGNEEEDEYENEDGNEDEDEDEDEYEDDDEDEYEDGDEDEDEYEDDDEDEYEDGDEDEDVDQDEDEDDYDDDY